MHGKHYLNDVNSDRKGHPSHPAQIVLRLSQRYSLRGCCPTLIKKVSKIENEACSGSSIFTVKTLMDWPIRYNHTNADVDALYSSDVSNCCVYSNGSNEQLHQVVDRFIHSSMFCEMRTLHDSMVSLAVDRVIRCFGGGKHHTPYVHTSTHFGTMTNWLWERL